MCQVTIWLPAVQTDRSWSEGDILWEDGGEDKDDSDWLTDSDTVMGDDGESDE